MSATMKLPELFGSLVFNEETMKERLSSASYSAWKRCITDGTSLDIGTANEIAEAMKQWAVEKGATHYTHWFQPMTGVTAEKHDSFISPVGGGKIIMEFSGKELVRGEPDASSFPSGGLRATFEARGYTAWDPTSFAFIKEGCPVHPHRLLLLLRRGPGQEDPPAALHGRGEPAGHPDPAALRRHGDASGSPPRWAPSRSISWLTRSSTSKREDLRFCGRTLFGAKPPKGQELEDHYFGAIKPRVAAYMKDLDETLWALGVLTKTKHNEVAPCPARDGPHLLRRQHRLRPEPAGHGDHEEGGRPPRIWCACCMKSPLRASTAPASTTTGPSPPTAGKNLLQARLHPQPERPVPAVPGGLHQGRG